MPNETKVIPALMRVETSTYCNQFCSFCPNTQLTRQRGEMPFELFKKLVNEHSKVSGAKILFPATVGEPLLDKRIFDFMKFASSYYKDIAMFTNSSLLFNDTAERLIHSGLTEIILTLHGFTKEIYTKITGYSEFEQVKENISNFLDINYRYHNPVNVYFNIYTQVDKDSVLKDDLIRKTKDYGINVTIKALDETHNWGGTIRKATTARPYGCKRIYKQFGVLFNGEVVPCVIDYDARYPLGNVSSHELVEIFQSEGYINLTNKEKQLKLSEINLCSHCDLTFLS